MRRAIIIAAMLAATSVAQAGEVTVVGARVDNVDTRSSAGYCFYLTNGLPGTRIGRAVFWTPRPYTGDCAATVALPLSTLEATPVSAALPDGVELPGVGL